MSVKNPLVLVFVFLLAFLVFFGFFLARSEAEKQDRIAENAVRAVLSDVKAAIENRLYWNIHRMEGVKALVAMNPELDQHDFERAMAIYFQGEHDLRNIGLARGMVIQYVYPLAGNEAAIGLDYTTRPEQFAAADLARRLNKTILAGPINLVQGGVGIIARIPIFLDDGQFWGQSSVVLDMDAFYRNVGMDSLPTDIALAIRGKDASGAQGEVFWGSAAVFESKPLTANVELPYGSWQIGALPVNGWPHTSLSFTRPVALYSLAALLLASSNFALFHVFRRMRQAEAEAKRLNQAKSEFLANMSHEIRTPLNGVLGFTELLKNTTLTPIQQQYVENANLSGHTLLDIINDILDFSKIEAGMMQLELIRTDIREVFEHSIDIVHYAAERKNLELLLSLDPALPRFAVVDPIRLKQILANLLGNAVKFTARGEVELRVAYSDNQDGTGCFDISVRDTGIGISASQKERLFKAFSQADSSTTRKFGGTGLGLIISDLLAQQMGSKITIESTQGEGSSFGFILSTEVADDTGESLRLPERFRRCLLVEDNARSRHILRQLLESLGLQCEACASGEAALALLHTDAGPQPESFDVLICDDDLPGLNGLETIEAWHREAGRDASEHPGLLMYKPGRLAELEAYCDRFDNLRFLPKPVKQRELIAALRQIAEAAPADSLAHPAAACAPVDPEPLPVADWTGRRILIAEDVAMNLLMLKTMLGNLFPGIDLLTAVNGREAVEKWQREGPELILMDIQMPDLDGLAATREIRQLEAGKSHTAIVALTAGAFKEEEERCLAAGMDGFLTKPVEPASLREAVTAGLMAGK